MSKATKFLFTLILPLFAAGCTCTSIGNLTPGQYPRNSTGFYRVEASWRTCQADVIPGSIAAAVKVGAESFDMTRVPVVQDRWEAFVPVPSGADEIQFHYKFDFQETGFGAPQPDSLMSREYRLKVSGAK